MTALAPALRRDEIAGLSDLAATRRALARSDAGLIRLPHVAGLLAHSRARGSSTLDPTFRFRARGTLRGLSETLRPALRAAAAPGSARTVEALMAEITYLAHAFAGLVDDPELLVRLAVIGGGAPAELDEPGHRPRRLLLYGLDRPGETPAPMPLARIAAVFDPAGATRWPAGELPAGEAFLLAPDDGIADADAAPPSAAGTGRRLVLCLSSERRETAPPPLPAPPAEPAEVVLLSMPFGPLLQPSLGLSLLAAGLEGRASARVLYLNMPFARRVGVTLYEWITEGRPAIGTLLGEWLFRDALFPDRPAPPEPFLDEVLLASTRRWQADDGERPFFRPLIPDGAVASFLTMRRLADRFVDDCVETVLAHRPRVVGLTSIFQQHAASLALARRLAARAPEVAVVFGGPNCEGVMGLELVRQFPFVDAVVSGEGDEVFPELVARLLAGRPFDDLRGVYGPRSPEVIERSDSPPSAPSPRDLDRLPYVRFDDYFAQWHAAGLDPRYGPRVLFETSRGCWWGEKQHCTFCGLNGTNMAFRSKSAERALDELRHLVRRHPGCFVGTVDNILDMRYFRTLLPRLADEKLPLRLFYEVKANLGKKHLRLLRAAGVNEIQPGIESLSDRVLAIMKKGVSALQNVQLLKWCQELGIWPLYNLIWGFPGEPEDAYAGMAEILPLLHHLPPPAGMSKIYLERFSPNHSRAEELGFADVRAVPAYGHVFPFAQDVLDRMAYQFAYGYREPRDVSRYTYALQAQVVAWREAHARSRLLVIEQGERLLICDTRSCARQNLHALDGLAAALYRAGDAAVSIDRLARRLAAGDRDAVEEALAPLLDHGLMIRRGERVLALGLPHSLDPNEPDPRPQRGG